MATTSPDELAVNARCWEGGAPTRAPLMSAMMLLGCLLCIQSARAVDSSSEVQTHDLCRSGDARRGSTVESAGLSSRVDEVLHAFVPPEGPGAIVAVTTDGTVRHLKGYGPLDPRHGRVWSPGVRYPLASITETFTASAILDLADDGKLRLTDAITQYIPSLSPAARTVTIADLLTMSSGLWDAQESMQVAGEGLIASPDDDISLTPAGMDSYAAFQPVSDFRPGTQFRHTSTDYGLLARVIEKVTGKSFETALAELVLAPAGMSHSAAIAARNVILPCSAVTYRRGDDHWRNLSAVALATSGDGALVASMEDMLSWMRYMSQQGKGDSRFIRQADLQHRIAGPLAFYRVGLMLFRHAGYVAVGNAGETGTLYIYIPDLSLSLVIFSNGVETPGEGAEKVRRLAANLIDAYLQTYPGMRPAARFASDALALPLDPLKLPANTFPPGMYVSQSTGEALEIKADDGQTTVSLMGEGIDSWWQVGKRWHGAGLAAHVTLRSAAAAALPAIDVTYGSQGQVRAFTRVKATEVALPVAQALAGWYFSDALQTYCRIGVINDAPYLAIKSDLRPSARLALRQLSPSLFRAGNLFVRLQGTAAPHVMSFTLSTARMRNVPFVRVRHDIR